MLSFEIAACVPGLRVAAMRYRGSTNSGISEAAGSRTTSLSPSFRTFLSARSEARVKCEEFETHASGSRFGMRKRNCSLKKQEET